MVSLENQETHSHLLSKKVARRQIKQNINIKLSPDSLQTSMACLKSHNKRCLENVKRHLTVRCTTEFSQLINNMYSSTVSCISNITNNLILFINVDVLFVVMLMFYIWWCWCTICTCPTYLWRCWWTLSVDVDGQHKCSMVDVVQHICGDVDIVDLSLLYMWCWCLAVISL